MGYFVKSFQVNIWMVTKEAFVTVPRKKELSVLLHALRRVGIGFQEAFPCLRPQGLELCWSVRLSSLLHCSSIAFAFLVKHKAVCMYRHIGRRSGSFLCHEHKGNAHSLGNILTKLLGEVSTLDKRHPSWAPTSQQSSPSSWSHNWNDHCLSCGGVAAHFQRLVHLKGWKLVWLWLEDVIHRSFDGLVYWRVGAGAFRRSHCSNCSPS